MLRVFTFALLAMAFGVGSAGADEVKKDVAKGAKATKREVTDDVHGAFHSAEGVVKSVSPAGFVLADESGKDLAFEVDSATVVYAGGASHKMNKLRADGKPAQITEFLSSSQHVSVRYSKPEDRLVAKDVRVKP